MSAEILSVLSRIEAKLDRLLSPPSGARPSTDSEVRNDPKSWTGPSYKGRKFSECPPDYLGQLASLFDWIADREDEAGAKGETNDKGYPKSGKWKRQDAALARDWAAFIAKNDAGDELGF